MKVAIPLFGTRVSPNFLHAGSLMLVGIAAGELQSKKIVVTEELTENERLNLLEDLGVTTLICGGIDRDLMAELEERDIQVLNNARGEAEQLVTQLALKQRKSVAGDRSRMTPERGAGGKPSGPTARLKRNGAESAGRIDCIECDDRVCLRGIYCQKCPMEAVVRNLRGDMKKSLEVTLDIVLDPERVLCRIAEVVYYCQGMGHQHIGLAFCTDLLAESETVAKLLKRFFQVTPICCKIGGVMDREGDPLEAGREVHCNPVGMARVLNKRDTDINIMIGLCIGCDVTFTQLSHAPVTTLFIKDRLLANNPIGAVYSTYQQENLLSRI